MLLPEAVGYLKTEKIPLPGGAISYELTLRDAPEDPKPA